MPLFMWALILAGLVGVALLGVSLHRWSRRRGRPSQDSTGPGAAPRVLQPPSLTVRRDVDSEDGADTTGPTFVNIVVDAAFIPSALQLGRPGHVRHRNARGSWRNGAPLWSCARGGDQQVWQEPSHVPLLYDALPGGARCLLDEHDLWVENSRVYGIGIKPASTDVGGFPWEVQQAAVELVEELRTLALTQPSWLLGVLDQQETSEGRSVLLSLAWACYPSAPEVRWRMDEALEGGSPAERVLAILALDESRIEEVVALFLTYDLPAELWEGALPRLGPRVDPRVMTPFCQLALQIPSLPVVKSALEQLGRFEVPPDVRLLAKGARRGDDGQRVLLLTEAAAELRSSQAETVLLLACARRRELRCATNDICRCAVSALASWGTVRAVPVLRACAEDTQLDPAVRDAAGAAAARVRERVESRAGGAFAFFDPVDRGIDPANKPGGLSRAEEPGSKLG